MTGMTGSVRTAIAAASLLLLAACSGLPGQSGSSGSDVSGHTQATPPSRATAVPNARPQRTWTVADLMDADTTKVDGIMGPPDIVRREGAGEMRIYRNSSCVVHVFLFPRADQLYTTHVEARANAARLDERQAGACISSFS